MPTTAITIRQAIERVLSGNLRIPAFQRGFVWDAELVAYLMDSIYKGYPFGALVLWRTKTQLRSERALGPFELPQKDPDYPVDYVLDGQQRLTSIFGVFQTELKPVAHADTAWTRVYYDFEADKDLQESQFLALPPDPAPAARYFPVSTFFDSVAYRTATQTLDEQRVREIDGVQTAFKESEIPIQVIETNDRDKVAIVFERVNRLGVELDPYQLLSAWAWSEEFDLQERFRDLAGELQPFGFADIGEDSTLLLRCCAAVVAEDVSTAKLLSLNGTKVREQFDEIANGLRGAVDFLRSNLGIERLANMPYPAMIVPLSVFFSAKDGVEVKVTNQQREELLRWFWRSCFSRRYSSAVLRNLNRDIEEAKKLRVTGNLALAAVTAVVDEKWVVENQFNVSTVNTKIFVLMLAQARPRSLVSGNPIDLSQVLQTYNRAEFHHLMPQAYLRTAKAPESEIGVLANFAFISSSDNKTLGGGAPSVYRTKMPGDVAAILEHALVPDSLFRDNYERFKTDRAAVLAAFGKKLAGL